ncbi:MAG: hypothetical protein H7645_03685 [Candidatus Heimdallarchaeota archaeon]|nr:hypothetical protein [Candidatus Heimdallarchaeota archaeon]MCK4769417.1 hypothetical protein [Candidatus Heimdallarchaeota archaeon]
MATSTLFDKLKTVSQNQKKNIKENLQTRGELPWKYQILIVLGFWFLLFLVMFVLWNPNSQWGVIIIASVGSVIAVEGVNYFIRRVTAKSRSIEEELEEGDVDQVDLKKQSILIGDSYKRGFAVLAQRRKNTYTLTPLIVLEVHLVSSSSLSVLSSLSKVSLQKISLQYNCSIVDTSRYEVLLLKGNNQSCKQISLLSTIKNLENTFFLDAIELVNELKREKRIEFECPKQEILKELFPSHGLIVNFETHTKEEINSVEVTAIEIKTEETFPLDEDDVFSEEEIKYLQEDLNQEALSLEESEEDKIQKSMIKEVLLKELDFSIDSFLTTAREYYKKAIERNLESSFAVKTNTFLKFVHLFCDKNDMPFFYPSYSYLLKIIEFLDVEMPSSTDIENFINKLANEFVEVAIPDEIKEELYEALNKKFNNNGSSNQVIEDVIDSKISSIPLPPEKNTKNTKIERGTQDD